MDVQSRSPAEQAIREEYFKSGPKYYARYASLHNTPTAVHPAIYMPDQQGRNPDRMWPSLRYEVESLSCRFGSPEPTLMEDELYLIVTLPEFTAKATINVKNTFDSDGSWQFGWITAVSDFRASLLCHRVPDDDAQPPAAAVDAIAAAASAQSLEQQQQELHRHVVARWELPFIHIACSSGECPPWYSRESCSERLGCAVADAQTIEVEMRFDHDRVLPRAPWRVLLPGGYVAAHKYCVDVEYTSWLVLRNLATESMHVVRTVVWDRRLRVNIDVTKPVGCRCKLAEPLRDRVTSERRNLPLPEWSLGPPYAHQELTLKAYTLPASTAAGLLSGDCQGDGEIAFTSGSSSAAAIVVEGPNNHYLNLPKM